MPEGIKDRILSNLKKSGAVFVSGEELSRFLNVSRTSVWKYINELKQEGYVIESSSRKGYRLVSVPDIINVGELSYGLNTRIIGKSIYTFDSLDSTNNYAKKLASEGCSDGTVVVAEKQTAGRGRLGRKWSSKAKSGIWMSVVLKPSIPPQDVQLITIAASVAVASAIEETAGVRPGIKWPNDILLDGRKLCGILTEMSCEMERVIYIVLGIGINIKQKSEDFPEELRGKAVSLNAYLKERHFPVPSIKRSDIIKRILVELEEEYDRINEGRTGDIIERWKEYSVTLGKEVIIVSEKGEYAGIAEDIASDGKLIVRCNDGKVREIISGEVSLKSGIF